MKRALRIAFVLAGLLSLSSSQMGGCGGGGGDDPPESLPGDVAFIISEEGLLGAFYTDTLLEQFGWQVDLISKEYSHVVATWPYKLIIIDTSAGLTSGTDPWNSSEVMTLFNTGTPIFAMGEGGRSFYELLPGVALPSQSIHGVDDAINTQGVDVVDPAPNPLHGVFTSPHTLNSPVLQLFSGPMGRSLLDPAGLHPSVEVLAMDSDYPTSPAVVIREERLLFWGYTGYSWNWNQTAIDLMENIIHYLISQ